MYFTQIFSNLDTYPNELYAAYASLPLGGALISNLTLKNPNASKYKRVKYTANSDNSANTFVLINDARVHGTGYVNVGNQATVAMRTDTGNRTAPSCTLYWST